MKFEVEPEPEVRREIDESKLDVDRMVKEAMRYLDSPDVDDIALARMFMDRGVPENVSYWMVREAETRFAPR